MSVRDFKILLTLNFWMVLFEFTCLWCNSYQLTHSIHRAWFVFELYLNFVWMYCTAKCIYVYLILNLIFSVFFRELPHSPRNLQVSLNETDSRTVLLSWVRPFDGNSPLLHYIIELSENSKCVRVLFIWALAHGLLNLMQLSCSFQLSWFVDSTEEVLCHLPLAVFLAEL